MKHDYNAEDMKFVKEMIGHHEQAVEMAAIVYHKGKNEQIKQLAYDIYNAQKSEIELMKNWLRDRGQSPSSKMSGM